MHLLRNYTFCEWNTKFSNEQKYFHRHWGNLSNSEHFSGNFTSAAKTISYTGKPYFLQCADVTSPIFNKAVFITWTTPLFHKGKLLLTISFVHCVNSCHLLQVQYSYTYNKPVHCRIWSMVHNKKSILL